MLNLRVNSKVERFYFLYLPELVHVLSLSLTFCFYFIPIV